MAGNFRVRPHRLPAGLAPTFHSPQEAAARNEAENMMLDDEEDA